MTAIETRKKIDSLKIFILKHGERNHNMGKNEKIWNMVKRSKICIIKVFKREEREYMAEYEELLKFFPPKMVNTSSCKFKNSQRNKNKEIIHLITF